MWSQVTFGPIVWTILFFSFSFLRFRVLLSAFLGCCFQMLDGFIWQVMLSVLTPLGEAGGGPSSSLVSCSASMSLVLELSIENSNSWIPESWPWFALPRFQGNPIHFNVKHPSSFFSVLTAGEWQTEKAVKNIINFWRLLRYISPCSCWKQFNGPFQKESFCVKLRQWHLMIKGLGS